MSTPRTVVKVAKNSKGQAIAKLFSDGSINILDIRASYPHLDEKWAKDKTKDTPAYSITGILPVATHQAAIDLLNEVCMDILTERNRGKDIKDDLKFIRDGKPTKKEEYKGSWIVAARETDAPLVLHPDKSLMESPAEIKREIKAGYFIDLLIQPWWQDNTHGQRVNASLRAVRFRREGPLIAEGGISKDDAISSFEDDDEGGFGGSSEELEDENGGL